MNLTVSALREESRVHNQEKQTHEQMVWVGVTHDPNLMRLFLKLGLPLIRSSAELY